MKLLLATLALAIGLPASSLRAEEAVAILDRVLAHRPTKDLALKARLFLTRERFVPVEILIQHTPADTRTLYRGAQTELLVVQPLTAEPRYYLKGAGELTGARRLEKLLGSQFVFYDLGLPFLHWPGPKLVGEERTRGRDCFRIECQAAGQPYARVKLWIDKEYGAFVMKCLALKGEIEREFKLRITLRQFDNLLIEIANQSLRSVSSPP